MRRTTAAVYVTKTYENINDMAEFDSKWDPNDTSCFDSRALLQGSLAFSPFKYYGKGTDGDALTEVSEAWKVDPTYPLDEDRPEQDLEYELEVAWRNLKNRTKGLRFDSGSFRKQRN